MKEPGTADAGLARVREALAALRLPSAASLSDRDLLQLQRSLGEVRRMIDAAAVPLAAETARRSARELGHSGLAQRLGVRTPEMLVQRMTGVTAREARDLVAVGSLDGASLLGSALQDRRVSVAAASVIASGLGAPSASVTPEALEDAEAVLVAEAPGLTVEQLAARARELRDELDSEGVGDRFERMRERRFLRLTAQDDGMTRLLGLLDPESAARVKAVVDSVTSPRRGGPRFVAPDDVARAEEIVADPRTTDQLALDAVVDLLEAGAAFDPNSVRAVHVAPVQVLVTARDLEAGHGVARIEGQTGSVPMSLARRAACTGGTAPVIFDDRGRVLDVGRERRLFTRAQRRALAARDGGCRVPGCERPPSWCEAHHIVQWSRGGRTDVADGVLLCRHHHLMIHDNGWRIERDGASYFLIPPEREDPLGRRIPMPTKNPLIRRLAG